MKCKNKALKNAYIIFLSSKKGAEYNILYIISNKTFFPQTSEYQNYCDMS